MNRAYELLEVVPVRWPHRVAVVSGLELAKARLRELVDHTSNECFAAAAQMHQTVGQMKVVSSETAKP